MTDKPNHPAEPETRDVTAGEGEPQTEGATHDPLDEGGGEGDEQGGTEGGN